MAPRLSHNSRGGAWIGKYSSLNRDNNHTVSDITVARERYPASVDDQATTRCFFLALRDGAGPKKGNVSRSGSAMIST